jgi:hypothetical protein
MSPYGVALVLWSVAKSRVASASRVALSPRLRTSLRPRTPLNNRHMRKRLLMRIQCQYNITVDGEPGAISSSGDIRYVVQESFFMVGCGISSTADYTYRLDVACDIYPLRRAGRYITTYPVPAASSLYEMTELVICSR